MTGNILELRGLSVDYHTSRGTLQAGWWDHWLKGKPTGIMDEPMLRLWMQGSVAPAPFYAERPSRWIAERQWPSPDINTCIHALGPGSLGAAPGPGAELTIRSPQATGIAGVRMAVSTAYWPIIWPSPEATLLTLFTGPSRLILRARRPRADDATLRPVEPAESAPPLATTVLRPSRIERWVRRDIVPGEVEFAIEPDDGRLRQEATGTVLEFLKSHRYRIHDDDPLSAISEVTVTVKLERDDWRPEVRARCVWSGTCDAFLVRTDLDVFNGEERVFSTLPGARC